MSLRSKRTRLWQSPSFLGGDFHGSKVRCLGMTFFMLTLFTQRLGKLEFAGRARGQCVTNRVYPITSFGPLDQKPLENLNLMIH